MGDETASQTFRQFYTQEEPNVAFRPELLIDFTPASVPEHVCVLRKIPDSA